MSSYGFKTVPKSLRVLVSTLLGVSRDNCIGVARIVWPHTERVRSCEGVCYELTGPVC